MKRIRLKVNSIQKGIRPYITQYLGFLGIKPEDVGSFTYMPRATDEDDPSKLVDINAAKDTLMSLIHEKDSAVKIFVQVDSDTDGYTSAGILINYLKRRFPAAVITWSLHSGKQHGVDLETVPADADLVVIPDAGSNQTMEMKKLVEEGKKVIVLDHHEIVNEADFAARVCPIVNNQTSPEFTNKYLSGAGIAYMFIKWLDTTVFKDDNPLMHRDYLDLAAIGIIADAMNMTSLGNNYIAYYGLRNIKNKMIAAIAAKQGSGTMPRIKDVNKLTKIDVAFYIAPIINGVIRGGAPEDKEAVFKGIITSEDNNDYTREWRGVTYHETLWEMAARLAFNAKNRQDSNKKKAFTWLCEKVRAEGHAHDNIIIADLHGVETTKVSPNITGLIAMEMVKEFNRPCLVVRETEDPEDGQMVLGGSGRNGNFYNLPSLLDFLSDSGLVKYVAGHANAHGVFIEPDKLDALREYANSKLDPQIFEDIVFEVDYWFHSYDTIDKDMLMEFAENVSIYGNSIPQPKFAFNFNITSADFRFMGKDGTSIKINKDDVEFVIFTNPEVADALKQNGNQQVQIVARAQVNEFMGRKTLEMMVDDIQLTPISINLDEPLPTGRVISLI